MAKQKVKKQRNIKGGVKAGASKGTKAFGAVLFYFVAGLLLYSLATGYINQRKTGEAFLQYYENITHKVGNFLTGQSEKSDALDGTGVHMTEDGVYVDGYEGTEDNPIEKPSPENGASEAKIPIID